MLSKNVIDKVTSPKESRPELRIPTGAEVQQFVAARQHASIQTTVDIYGHVIPASDVEAGMMIEKKLKS